MPAYRFWATYFRNGVTEAGHEYAEVPDVDWAEGCTNLTSSEVSSWREQTWSKTLRWINTELAAGRNFDLFLSYFFPQQVEPGAIAEIQRLGIPCVNFFCDNVREFTRVPNEFRCFDLHWIPEFEALPMYKTAGLKACFAPMPCWVAPETRSGITSENGQVTFIGSSDHLRRALLGKAISLGAPIKIGGVGWKSDLPASTTLRKRSVINVAKNQMTFLKNHGAGQLIRRSWQRIMPSNKTAIPNSAILPVINDRAYMTLTKESSVTLGINRVATFQRSLSNPLTYSRLRDIEAPMMGACYLTEWTQGLPYLYEIGNEIETYKTPDEMVIKISELAANESKRAALRVAGQRRALTDHTIRRSIDRIWSELR